MLTVSSSHHSKTLYAGGMESSSPLASLVPIRVKLHGHHPNENKMENITTPKLIILPDSVEDLFRVAGMSVMTSYIPNACMTPKDSEWFQNFSIE